VSGISGEAPVVDEQIALRRADLYEVRGVAGDQSQTMAKRDCGDHHVRQADDAPDSLEVGIDPSCEPRFPGDGSVLPLQNLGKNVRVDRTLAIDAAHPGPLPGVVCVFQFIDGSRMRSLSGVSTTSIIASRATPMNSSPNPSLRSSCQVAASSSSAAASAISIVAK
jgi:hypothetical protein